MRSSSKFFVRRNYGKICECPQRIRYQHPCWFQSWMERSVNMREAASGKCRRKVGKSNGNYCAQVFFQKDNQLSVLKASARYCCLARFFSRIVSRAISLSKRTVSFSSSCFLDIICSAVFFASCCKSLIFFNKTGGTVCPFLS